MAVLPLYGIEWLASRTDLPPPPHHHHHHHSASIELECGWASEPVLTLCKRGNVLSRSGFKPLTLCYNTPVSVFEVRNKIFKIFDNGGRISLNSLLIVEPSKANPEYAVA